MPAGLVAWSLAVILGFFELASYELAAGDPMRAPQSWPEGASVNREPDRFTLLMFLHPHCPCTRASLFELDRLLADVGDATPATWILAVRPKGVSPGWERTDLLDDALRLPGITMLVDHEGREARRFGATTSGGVVLYDRDGMLRFAGGLTASRGHAGDSLGRDALAARILDEAPASAVISVPVFGCSLAAGNAKESEASWTR